jgi:hypothetical protein
MLNIRDIYGEKVGWGLVQIFHRMSASLCAEPLVYLIVLAVTQFCQWNPKISRLVCLLNLDHYNIDG